MQEGNMSLQIEDTLVIRSDVAIIREANWPSFI